MARTRKDELIWEGLQRLVDSKGLQVTRGIIQDATLIEAYPGRSKRSGGENVWTRLSKDGTWAKKDDELHFGYKLHPVDER